MSQIRLPQDILLTCGRSPSIRVFWDLYSSFPSRWQMKSAGKQYQAVASASCHDLGRGTRARSVLRFARPSAESPSHARGDGRVSAPQSQVVLRLMNAASLLWIAEAVGIDSLTVKMAYDAAVEAGDYRRACGAVRKIITWDMIYACV